MNRLSRGGVLTMVVAAGVVVTMAGADAQQSNFIGGNPVADAIYKAAPKK